MVDTILDDIIDLINQEKGDYKILERIKRAAERNEVISVYERDYVKRLVETHIRLPPDISDKQITPKIDAHVLKTIPTEKFTNEKVKKKPLFVSKSNPKTTKFAFGIGAVALAIILVVGISQFEFDDITISETPEPKITKKQSGLNLDVDSSSYQIEDIISISGSTDSSSSKVSLSISNSQGNIIWSEDTKTKSGGSYSTLVIVGGSGWENGEKYTLTVTDGELEEKISFTVKN